MIEPTHRRPETWIDLADLTQTPMRPYLPTYEFPGEFLNAEHAQLADLKTGPGARMIEPIDGYITRPDALKLYELAYFAPVSILEIGCRLGLSTAMLAMGAEAGQGAQVRSFDIDPEYVQVALSNLAGLGLSADIWQSTAEGALLQTFFAYDLIFLDDDHSYEHVCVECVLLDRLLVPGGFVAIHDWTAASNADPQRPAYGVWQAVRDELLPRGYEFWGAFGGIGLFRRPSRDPNTQPGTQPCPE